MATKKEIEKEIAEYEALLNDSTVPQDEKDFAKDEIADLKKQSEGMEEKPKKEKKEKPDKKEKVKKEPKPKKEKKAKKTKTEKNYKLSPVYKYKGKNIKDLTDDECAELRKETKERREASAKASEKSKSKPVIEKVSGHVVKAVKQAITNVAAADIDKAEIKKFERVEAAGKAFVSELKTILGQDFDKSAVNEEFKEITDLIEKLRKKYAEPKK